MEFLTAEQVADWLHARGLVDLMGNVQPALERITLASAPADSGRKTSLGRLIASWFVADQQGLLWVSEHGIWPSSENKLIFDGLRRLAGQDYPLDERPGHLFRKSDEELLGAMVATISYFAWGAVLVSGSTDLVALISHDEYIDFYGEEPALKSLEVELRRGRYLTAH